ncbi:hypothetical protein BC937DRAFT_87171 [Endogone sp. FLAS-F59071]|nr:hypothetical protein BC937DRAFT_87171 [Endogone sp. FLAS-F59071]|eukprot:RUS22756.1 hypothetical protein BC937DRAFT_87171 [Endogone sp. FLAS-F59071]
MYSSSWSAFNENEEEDEENILTDDAETQFNNKDCILFVIDCSPPMLQPDDEGEIPFESAIKCARSVLMNKIISSESDLVGILLYGTEKKQNSTNFEHIYILQDLDMPDAQRIKEIEAVVNATGETKFHDEFGSTHEEFPLSEVFWTCTNMFSASAQKVGSKRIFLFTNEDSPHATNPELRNAAKIKARDLSEVGIRIELFNIDKPGQRFDFETFYKDIVDQDDEDDENTDTDTGTNGDARAITPAPGPSRKLKELMVKVRRKEVKKRSLFRLPLNVAEGITIGVRGYTLLMNQKRGDYRYVYMKGERVREVRTVTSWICSDTTQYLLPTDLKFYFPYGGEKEEIAEAKNFGDPAYVGFPYLSDSHVGSTFKSYSLLSRPPGILRQHSRLRCPPPQDAQARPHRHMQYDTEDQCCTKDRRAGATILDEDGGQDRPPGFHVITLPYAEDIRPIPVDQMPEAKEEQVEAAKAVIEKLQVRGGYRPENYENPGISSLSPSPLFSFSHAFNATPRLPNVVFTHRPALQRHYASLQAIALEQDVDEDVVDRTLPKVEVIHKRVGKQIETLKEKIWEGEPPTANIGSKGGTKRKAKDDGEEVKAKREKKTAANSEDLDMKALAGQGKVGKCTVSQLKEWLGSVGIKPQGLKADLVAQVENYFIKSSADLA